MNIEQYYLSLRNQYSSKHEGEVFPILMEELLETLNCTRRNAQLIVKKMVEVGYVNWLPGRGRGNTSKLTFVKPIKEIILERAKQLTIEEKLDEAWKLINQVQSVKFEFTEWLYHHFGFQYAEEMDVLRFPFYRPVLDLDPTFVNRRTEAHLIEQVFNTLVVFDRTSREIKPSLAHFWESNKDYTEWTFYLRKGVRFHHGKQMTADDVVFTFNRLLEESSLEELKSNLKSITRLNSYTVQFTLLETNVLFLNYLCTQKCSVLPGDLKEIHGFATMPIGTGPFRMRKNNESILLLEANDYYFEGRPYLDAIEMWIWPIFDRSKVIEKLEQQDIYFGDDQALSKDHKKIQHIEQGASFITINCNKEGPTQDEKFRKAVHFALDREKMINELGEMRCKPACSMFPDSSEINFRNEYDKELALKYLKSSSYNGEELQLFSYEMESNRVNANWIKKELNSIGINISVNILPIKELSRKDFLEKVDMIFSGEVLGMQPDISYIETLTYANGFIHNHLSEQQMLIVQNTIQQCKRETNDEERMFQLKKLEQHFQHSHNPIFLYHTKHTIQHNQAVNGIMLNEWGKVDYKDVWVKRNSGSHN